MFLVSSYSLSKTRPTPHRPASFPSAPPHTARILHFSCGSRVQFFTPRKGAGWDQKGRKTAPTPCSPLVLRPSSLSRKCGSLTPSSDSFEVSFDLDGMAHSLSLQFSLMEQYNFRTRGMIPSSRSMVKIEALHKGH